MTAPDRITITHQRPMITPTIRAALDAFQQAANRGTAVHLSPELVQELRDALEAGADADALAARPLLEQVAALADCIGAQTVGQIAAISNRAAAWLRENPPGQPVAIEPRGCPTPGACSCVEPAPPAPELGAKPSLDDVYGLCEEFGFYLEGNTDESAGALRDMITAALARWARPVTPPAPEPGKEQIEETAKLIYASMRFAVAEGPRGSCDWVERGNSLMQGEARRTARTILAGRDSSTAPAAPEDLAADQAMGSNLSALLIEECGLHSPGSSTYGLLQRAAAMAANYGQPVCSATPPAPELGEVPSDELMEQWKEECKRLSLESDYAIPASSFMAQRVVAWARQQQSTELSALREERFVAGQNRINQLWVDALDPSMQVPLSAPQIKKLRKVLDDHCDQGPPGGTMWKSQELEELMWAVEGWVSAATPLPAPQAGEVQRDAVLQAVAEALGGAYDCLRVWEAWNVGTMGPDDFTLTAEDDDRVAEIADAAIEAFRSFQVPAPQAGEGEA